MKRSRLLSPALAFAAFVLSHVAGASPLVDTAWLEKNLQKPDVRVFEVSTDPGVFERGHIPGAVNLRWHSDLVDTVSRNIVSKENFEKLLGDAGVKPGDTIVLYGDSNNWFAAWGAWVFEIYGVADVKLLDGGRKKWEAEGRQQSIAQASYAPTAYKVTKVNADLRAFLPEVVEVARGEKEAKLLDIRGPDEYSGKLFAAPGFQELAIRAGHVPGAVNVPWGRLVNEDGTFKSVDELRKIYADVGIDGSQPIIAYCRIGERSSHSWFALHRILGYPVKNYDGSWTEYGNAVGVPVANPAGTVWGGA